MTRVRAACAARADWLMATIIDLALLESPSGDKAALDRCGAGLAMLLAQAGGTVERVPQIAAGDHLLTTFGSGEAQVLLLGHFDTVWPVGTLAGMPVEVRDGRLHGPGTLDMKAGIAIALLAASVALPLLTRVRVCLLLTTDEEMGSGSSRALIERLARRSEAVLVFEPALPGGGLKTSRKGVGTFRLDVHGVSAHAGVAPEEGASAIAELARQVLAMDALQAPGLGTTLNTGLIGGGTRSNVVAESASAEIDVRVSRASEADRITRELQHLVPHDARVRLRVTGGFDRPPLERGPHVRHLFALARAAGEREGIVVEEGSTGGASDGNFTAALGVPTLDGLGARGDGAHARHEHLEIASLPDRAALAAAIMLAIDVSRIRSPMPDA